MPKPISFPFAIRSQLPPNSAFGYRPLYKDNHSGVDFNSTTGVTYGVKIPAAGDGRVVESYNGNSAGQSNWAKLRGTMVMIDHGDGWATRYHMLVPNSNIPKGTLVKAGQIIGKVGNSGSSGTGAHLHFELWHNGKAINPVGQLTYNPKALAVGSPQKFDNTTVPPKPKDSENMIVVSNNANGEYFALAPEYIHWLGTSKDVNLISAISSTLDEIHKLDEPDFRVALEAYGVPWPMGFAEKLREYGDGDKWSRLVENQRKLDLLLANTGSVDTATLNKAIADAVAAQNIKVDVDYGAIGRAVLDTFHARTEA